MIFIVQNWTIELTGIEGEIISYW